MCAHTFYCFRRARIITIQVIMFCNNYRKGLMRSFNQVDFAPCCAAALKLFFIPTSCFYTALRDCARITEGIKHKEGLPRQKRVLN